MGTTTQRNRDKLLQILSKYGTFLYGSTCMTLTLYLTGISLYHYLENSDTSVMNPRVFNERDQRDPEGPLDVYPTYTLCFVDDRTKTVPSFYEHDGIYRSWYVHEKKGVNWPSWTNGLKPWHKYRDFLTGADLKLKVKEKDKKERQLMSDIDFKKATKKLSHFMYMMEVVEIASNETRNIKVPRDPTNPGNRSSFDHMLYLTYQSPNQLCYTRKSNNERGHKKFYEKLTFRSGTLYSKGLSDIYLYVHHPGQFYRKKSQVLQVNLLYTTIIINNYYHTVEIATTDILRKRPDAEHPCNKNLDLNDDKHWIKSAIEMVNCVPPFWKFFYEWENSTFLNCKTSEQFQMVSEILNNPLQKLKVMDRYEPPCAEMSIGVVKDYFEDSPLKSSRRTSFREGNLTITIKYPGSTYHEILNKREVSFESFWSSTGGFVGMFLGFSLMQIPQLIFGLFMWSTNKSN